MKEYLYVKNKNDNAAGTLWASLEQPSDEGSCRKPKVEAL